MAGSNALPNTKSLSLPGEKSCTPSSMSPRLLPLPKRFGDLKDKIASGSESPLESSWKRLLQQLRKEIDVVSSTKSEIIPAIDFADITSKELAASFAINLHERGVAVIRNVIPRETAMGWGRDLREYIGQDRHGSHLHDVFWSPSQIEARAHPNVLTAQKFAMGLWKSTDTNAAITTNFAISYADRALAQNWDPTSHSTTASVDGGSVERWENDGYGHAGPYRKILNGSWEEYDPWESSSRIAVTSDLYRGAGTCSIYRMFSGLLSLTTSHECSLQVLPIPKLATAYFLLRPFFSPVPSPSTPMDDDDHLSSSTWVLDTPQNSVLQGALPGSPQVIDSEMHPHLELEKSMISIPPLGPGDYVIWHPDLVHSIASTPAANRANTDHSTMLYLPACPLTQTNALYLSRQRKSLLLGYPGPDFDIAGCHSRSSGRAGDERRHPDRASVQEVNDAGGDDGLRAMGLLPWDEEDAKSAPERKTLAMANAILFPDLFDR